MSLPWWLLAAWLAGGVDSRRLAPAYEAAGVVSAASSLQTELAPNAIATVFGTGLAWTTRAIGPGDLHGDQLPTVLAGGGARVLVGNQPGHVYFISPTQVNFLVPANLRPGVHDFQVVLDGRGGPVVRVRLGEAAPALFTRTENLLAATRVSGGLVTPESPAAPGDWVVLYGTGFGQTAPAAPYGRIPNHPAALPAAAEFTLWIDGRPLPAGRIAYAGITPGFAGLYQVNVQLPDPCPEDPEVRVIVWGRISPAFTRLPVRRAAE